MNDHLQKGQVKEKGYEENYIDLRLDSLKKIYLSEVGEQYQNKD